MNKILGLGLNFTFVIGISLCLYSLFEKTNYNYWFSMSLCVCTAHWISDTIRKIVKEVEDDEKEIHN